MAPPKKFIESVHRFNCQFPESLFEQLRDEAVKQNIKINDLINQIVSERYKAPK